MQLTAAVVALALAASVTTSPIKKNSDLEIPLVKKDAVDPLTKNGKIDYEALHREIDGLRAKYSRTLDAYKKATGKVHPSDRRVVNNTKRSSGTVGLTDVGGEELWTGTIAFGSPPQSITIDFDTGSSDTLVNSGTYDPNSSSSSQDTGTTFRDSYGDGTTALGEVYTDELTIGGLQASGATIGLATSQFVQQGSGIAGMAFSSLAAFQQKTPFFYSLINAGVLDQQAFIFQLRQFGSTLTLGSAADGAQYVPVTQAGYWQVDSSINGVSTSSIVDSGTTLLVAPTSTAQSVFDALGLQSSNQNGELVATYDCSSPPDLTYSFGNINIPLGSTTSYGTDNNGNCVLALVGSDIGVDFVIAGDPLFQQTTITFDVANQQVGFS